MKPFQYMVSVVAFLSLLGLVFGASVSASAEVLAASAAPKIRTHFGNGNGHHEDVIHVEAEFNQGAAAVSRVLTTFGNYASLHRWILTSRLEMTRADDVQEVYMEFAFPWPVGRQWSRIAVKRLDHATIRWDQIEGSLPKNEGHMTLKPKGSVLRTRYDAIIDVGWPPALTRPFKKKFVSELLTAAHERAAESQPGPSLVMLNHTCSVC